MTANIDFDGVPMNMAMHLLDLHWNRLHLIYLQTYRPAIMDILINNGPYVNKLLLNAIYFQSSLYSDRRGLRMDAQDPQTTAWHSTDASRHWWSSVSSSLGKHNAGWVYCGMAYRIMEDLGYHLNIPKTSEEEAKYGLSATDMEIRRRVYWGAYVSDKYQSLFVGRLPAVRESDSNTPQEYLDSIDEMAQWIPYVDPEAPHPLTLGSLAYRPQSCYALSTFQSLLRLSMIAAQVIDKLYSVKSAITPKSIFLQAKRELTAQLTDRNGNLPASLWFDPDKDNTLPPHQLNLHITYCTLVILIEQAFLNLVRFESNIEQASQEASCQNCIKVAFKFWRILGAHRKTFTLRHPHYGEFYPAYSAVAVILQQAPQDHDQYIECVRFFWSMLSEPQRRSLGFALGLKKLFRLLKSLMRRIKYVAQQINVDQPENPVDGPPPSAYTPWTEALLDWETSGLTGTDPWAHPWYEAISDNMFSTDHSMFALFTQG